MMPICGRPRPSPSTPPVVLDGDLERGLFNIAHKATLFVSILAKVAKAPGDK
jgi:hypothetical protein